MLLAILRILLCTVRHSQVRGGRDKEVKNGLVLTLKGIETNEGVAVITESAETNICLHKEEGN